MESLIKAGALDILGSRAAQLLILDECLNQSHKVSRNKLSGQVSLFEGDDQAGLPLDLPQVDEMPLEQLLVFEKELLGFYLHEPPYLQSLQRLIRTLSLTISELNEEHIDQRIVLGGVIAQVKRVFTKKSNAEMAFVRISDGVADIELVVFPTIFEDSKEFLIRDQVVISTGRIVKREEEISLVVEKINLFDPDSTQNSVEIYIPKGSSASVLQNINRTLRGFPGNVAVALILPNGGSDLRKMKLPFSINPAPNLVEQINKLLGEEAFKKT